MADFPIQYAETLPTGRAAVARADLDVRTGAEEMARAVSGLGAALFESGRRIADAQKAMEFSTFKRREEEFRLSALQALTAPGFDANDDEAVLALKEKTNTDRDTLTSKWQSVNDTYQMYRNEIDPRWEVQFEGALQDIKARNVKDEFNLNAENLLGKGKLLEYQTLLEISLATDVISKAEYDFRTKSAPNDSILQQMDVQIDLGNPQGAIELSKQIADPSPDQIKVLGKLLRIVSKQNEENLEVTHQEYWQLLQVGNFDALEAKLNDPANVLPVTGDGGKNWWRNLIAKREETLAQTDLKAQSKVADAIIFEPHTIDPKAIRNYAGKGIKGGLSLDKVTEYENKYNLVLDKTSAINTPLAKTFFNELKNAETDRAFSIDKIKNNVIYGQSLDSLTDFFVDFRKKNARDPSLTETQEFYQNLISGYRTPERPFTDAKIQQTIGELESGGAVSIFGTVMPFSRPQDAINHLLRNLGPNWQKIAPEAARIIKERWPEAKISIDVVKITKPQELEIGQRIIHTDGNIYEYRPDGAEDQQPWKPIE